MRDRGFTTIELMVVVAIIGILTAVLVPTLPRWRANIRMNSVVKEVASGLQLARMKAIAQNTDVTVCFYGPSPNFPNYPNGFFSTHIDSNAWCPVPPSAPGQAFDRFKQTVSGLPPGVTVQVNLAIPNACQGFTFNSRGRGCAGNVQFSNAGIQTTKRITVDAIGRVRIDTL